ncbi:MAG: LuxR family transcriptional regulator [Microbacteriaceae bacterium]|jgi:DNA-binding CsgD family transcriptional regulator/signal transduction histidine kinase|nr:LuxR family transcriptional regulator [Microbacteriaceae bacterium]
MVLAEPNHSNELLPQVREVMAQSLLGIASALSSMLQPTVSHSALVIFTEDCTGRPQKKAGLAAIIDRVTIAELDAIRDEAAGMAFVGDVVIGGAPRRVAVWAADTAAILVLVDVEEADIPKALVAQVHEVWELIALSIRQQVAAAAPSYIADSRSASRDRASLIADLTDTQATTLESLLAVLRSTSHSDVASRQRAIDIAAAAMVQLRAVSDRDRLLAEEPVHSAFERLRDDLAPLVKHGGLDVEFVPPPVEGRPLPGEVAHAARAVVRGAVLALSDSASANRVRVQWDCDGSNLLIGIRDNGAGNLVQTSPGLSQLTARVAVLDGTITVQSTAGWGSQLDIAIPLDGGSTTALPGADGLTRREREVLALLIAGKRNRAIGKELTISENTVKFHVANVLRKTGTVSRAELAALAGSGR